MYQIIDHSNGLQFIEFYNKNDFHVVLSNYGASIYEIGTTDRSGKLETVTLSPILSKYYRNLKYLGLTVGRTAGRIKNGELNINGTKYIVPSNEKGNVLHGGLDSMAFKFYDYDVKEENDETIVSYKIYIKDMEDSYPGNLELRVIYHLYEDKDDILVEYQGISDKDTYLNITNHSYFNLSGSLKSNILNHKLMFNMDKVCEMDDNLIPLSLIDVPSSYDFRTPKLIGKDIMNDDVINRVTRGYDNVYQGNEPLHLELSEEVSGRKLTITSSYKGLVIYTNNFSGQSIFSNNISDSVFLGIAIEPSKAPYVLKENGLLLKKNALYNHYIKYSFSVMEENK